MILGANTCTKVGCRSPPDGETVPHVTDGEMQVQGGGGASSRPQGDSVAESSPCLQLVYELTYPAGRIHEV